MRLVKRCFALLLGGSLTIVLVAGLLFAQVEKGSYAPAPLGQLQRPAPAALTDDSVYQVSAYLLLLPK